MKRILRVYYILIISTFAMLIILGSYFYFKYDEKLLLGLLGIVATVYFGLTKVDMENDRLFKELFRDFNLRYTELNEYLHHISDSEKLAEELSFKEKDKVFDYFNLCAEEYYWYKKNRIPKKVWKSWKHGMKFWFNKKVIHELWQKEMNDEDSRLSYYMDKNEKFFDS